MPHSKSLLLLVCLGAVMACRHDLHDDTPFVQIDECSPSRDSMLQYYYFRTGTYWIYEEQTTGIIDSLVVYDDLDTNYNNSSSAFDTYVYSVHDDCTYHYFQQSFDDFESWIHPPCKRNVIWVDKFKPGVSVDEGRLFFYPFIQDEYIGNVSFPNGIARYGKTTIEEIMHNYVILGDTLEQVVRFHVDYDDVNFDNESTYDIAKNIGFVRKTRHLEDSTYEEWKLIRWHIVQ